MWDLSSLIRDQTHVRCVGRQILNHWTTREVWHHIKYLPKVTRLQSDRTGFNLTLLYYTPGASQGGTQFSSVSWSCLTSLQPHGLQHTRLPCPSPTPGVCSNSWPSSWWCHPTISSSVVPFSSCLQSFSASGSFPMSQFFTLGGQSIGASAWASVLSMNIQNWRNHLPIQETWVQSLVREDPLEEEMASHSSILA